MDMGARATSETESKTAETEEDVDEMVKAGLVKPSMAKLMKSSIRRKKKAASETKSKTAETEEDVDEMVKAGLVAPSMAKLMKSSIQKRRKEKLRATRKSKKPLSPGADRRRSTKTFTAKGKIKMINPEEKHGFIDIRGPDDVYFRLEHCYEKPRKGEAVNVTYVKDKEGKYAGKLRATHVEKSSSSSPGKSPHGSRSPGRTFEEKGEILKFVKGGKGKTEKGGYGFVGIGRKFSVYFKEKCCYENPKCKDMVDVEYYKTKGKDGKPMFCATSVKKDVAGMNLRAAAASLYDLTDGAISIDHKLYSDDPTAMTEILTVAKAMTRKYRVKRKQAIARAYGALKSAQNVQIAFLMDCTGSMGSHLHAANQGIEDIISTVKSNLPTANVHFAFIGYRDYDMPGIIKLDFTQDIQAFRKTVSGNLADGGRDEAEDVQSGLEALDALSWDSKIPSKLCFFIADAPCHGTFFAGKTSYNDDRPSFDSDGSKARRVLHSMYDKGVRVTHLKINDRTADMIRTYNKLLATHSSSKRSGNEECKVLVQPISEAREIIDVAIAKTIASVSAATATASVTLSSAGKSDRFSHLSKLRAEITKRESKLRKTSTTSRSVTRRSSKYSHLSVLSDITEERSATSFVVGESVKDKPGAQTVAVFDCAEPTSMSEIKRLGFVKPSKPRHLIIEDKEFDKGGVRTVQLTEDVTFDPPTRYVFKTYIKPKSEYEEEVAVKQDLQTQAVARFLAQQFSALPEIEKKIVYLKSKGVEFRDKKSARRFASIERVLEGGEYKKWFNNAGYAKKTDDPDFSATLETFSHWTYEATKKHLMVVDVQGIKASESTFILTDPGIHCVNETRYGDTNLSHSGFKLFFDAHRCNQLCKKLGLKNRSGKSVIVKGTGAVS